VLDSSSVAGTTLTYVLLVLVALGALPIIAMGYQFVLIPFHAFRNHYAKAAPYLPRVAVVIPAWNEGAVVGTSIDNLMALEYPADALRVYVVDDASTDDTPDVVLAKARQYPGQVFHLRRAKGGEGKAHTLNHGIAIILEDDWMEALLIMDADVVYLPDSLRKMTRHLADEKVGAVTAYIREGSLKKNYLTRFIALEYALSQAASRRAQNVMGAVACLAGGAQLHSRANLEELGGRIDTSSLAEDTVTTFKTQLAGRTVVFEPHAVVLAEEPQAVAALWKQRLRWGRGNVHITRMYRKLWFRKQEGNRLGSLDFGLVWFGVAFQPVAMVLSSVGLVGLYFLESPVSAQVFRTFWALAACTYIFTMVVTIALDPVTGRKTLREAIFFPGLVSVVITVATFFPGLLEDDVPALFGVEVSDGSLRVWTLFVYSWITLSMLGAWLIKVVDGTRAGRFLSPVLVYLVGYGPILCAITVDSYVKELRHADASWDKTEKTGRILA